MSLKIKLTILIATFILVCSLLTVGVFAVKNTTFNVGGNIEFNVKGIEADIELTTNGVQNAEFNKEVEIGKDVLSKIQIRNNTSAESVSTQFAKWSNLNMTFAEGQSTATIELKISNVATEVDNYIDITALADATTKENARIKVKNNAGGITALLKSGENATFTITFSVIDDEYKASLNNFLVNFDMKKKVLADFPSYDADSRITIECDTSAKTASVTGKNITTTANIVIPAYVQKDNVVCAVISIGDSAFKKSYSLLKSIIIPLSVTSIGDSAFYNCTGLTSITIPDSVESIGNDAFMQCKSLTSIVVGNGNSVYDSRNNCNAIIETATNTLINGCQTSIIPNSVTSIGDSAFEYCTGLTTIEIPDSVETIGNDAFMQCNSLISITIPDSVESIGNYAFYKCTSATSIIIGNGLISIGDYSFFDCGFTNITIPDSVTSIGDGAFCICKNLTSITIPDSVTSIGENTFKQCYSLTSITIPDSVTSIGDGAFSLCESLTSVEITDSVTSIGEDAFSGCSGLTSITIEKGITRIERYTFSSCDSLTSITIPDGVTNIEGYAFMSCDNLVSITLPVTVTSIGYQAFDFCKNLTTVNYRGTQEQWNALLKKIDSRNDYLKNATLVFNYTGV